MNRNILGLAEELCKFSTGVVADENEELFERIKQELSLKFIKFKSGEEFNGWVVPKNWKVLNAKIYKDNKLVFDGESNEIAVARYSKSFSGKLSFEELKEHIVTNRNLPEAYLFHCAWQYRPWDADWAFSIPFNVFKKFYKRYI